MAACWRSLAAQPDINLWVVAFQAKTETAFAERLMAGIPCHLMDLEARQNTAHVTAEVAAHTPDVIVVSGWLHRPYRQLVASPALRHVPCIMGMDTPWRGTWKQRLAPYLLRPYLQRMAQVVVTGDRSWTYARHLGVPPERLHKGLYGIDSEALSPLLAARQSAWPQSFLFIGRYVPEKGLDRLVAAYQQYRQMVDNPWPLVCCGQGPLGYLLQDQPGITDLGFVQPDELPVYLQQAGAFILPSRFDPWPLAIVEAAAAGLPVLCTDACGSSVELIRPGYTGWIVPSDQTPALSQGLVTLHQHYHQLPLWGQRAQIFAQAYSASLWASQWRDRLVALASNLSHLQEMSWAT